MKFIITATLTLLIGYILGMMVVTYDFSISKFLIELGWWKFMGISTIIVVAVAVLFILTQPKRKDAATIQWEHLQRKDIEHD